VLARQSVKCKQNTDLEGKIAEFSRLACYKILNSVTAKEGEEDELGAQLSQLIMLNQNQNLIFEVSKWET